MGFREIFLVRLPRWVRDRLSREAPAIPGGLQLRQPSPAPRLRDLAAGMPEETREQVLREAGEILEGRYRFFGVVHELPDDINWHRDFRTGAEWPVIPAARLDYRAARGPDPKDIWELNRHHFLPVLGLAYAISGDERYPARVIRVLDSWIEQNPWGTGIHWTSPIETSLRLISWSWTLRLTATSPLFTAAVRSKVAGSIYRQASYIARNLSLGSSAGNHLAAELAGLVIAGQALAQPRWVALGVAGLAEQARLQIRSDGSGCEQSTSYLAYTLEYLVLAMLEVAPSARPPDLLERVARGGGFLAALLGDRETPPDFGDNDSGEILRLGGAYSRYRSLLNTIGWLTGRPELTRPDVAADAKSALLTDGRALASPPSAPASPAGSRAFEAGGTYVLDLEAARGRLLFDCGPQGLPPLYGHGHADALEVLLEMNGHDILVDPGTFTYYRADFWRNHFRGTSAHNTVRIDGHDQIEVGGRFLTTRPAQARCTDWQPGRRVEGTHDGYTRLGDAVVHKRAVEYDEAARRILIIDTLQCSAPHRVELFFHLDTACRLRAAGRGSYLVRNNDTVLTLTVAPSLEAQVYFGDAGVPLGWQSRLYGLKEPAFAIAARGLASPGQPLITEIRF